MQYREFNPCQGKNSLLSYIPTLYQVLICNHIKFQKNVILMNKNSAKELLLFKSTGVTLHQKFSNIKPHTGLSTERGKWTWALPLTKKQCAIDSCQKGKITFLQWNVTGYQQPHSRAGPMLRNSWPTQKELHGFLWIFCFILAF